VMPPNATGPRPAREIRGAGRGSGQAAGSPAAGFSSIGTVAASPAVEWPLAAAFAGLGCHGRARASQVAPAVSSTAHRIQPSAVVPTPAYFSPDAKITKVIAGRMYLSGARDDRNDPISTAGTPPRTDRGVTRSHEVLD